jgi:tRNA(Arg) A34 adenosine deaminase TadA
MGQSKQSHLRTAIELAGLSRVAGDPPFGSLLVGPDGAVLREGVNTTVTGGDITAHPELKLARWAAEELDQTVAGGTTMSPAAIPAPCASP